MVRLLGWHICNLAWKTIGRIMLIAQEDPLQLGLRHLEDPVAGPEVQQPKLALPCKQTTQ